MELEYTVLCSASAMQHGVVQHDVSGCMHMTHRSSCVAGRPSTSDAVPKQHLDMTCNMNIRSSCWSVAIACIMLVTLLSLSLLKQACRAS